MPEPDFIVAPDRLALSVALEPAHNALHSLFLLTMAEKYSGLDPWVERTAAALTPQQRDTQRLVFEGLHFAIIPVRSWPGFPTYLDDLAALPPTVLRDRLLDAYYTLRSHKKDIPAEALPTREALLADAELYLDFLKSGFEHVDEALEREAHALLNDLPTMQAVILAHLRMLWEDHLAEEWARVEPVLQEVVEAWQQPDLARMSLQEAARRVTGQDLAEEKLAYFTKHFERIVFVPSAHIGPYQGKLMAGKTAWLFFGARLPEGAQHPSSALSAALSRSELLVRLNALADEARLRILALVAEHGELCAQDLIAMLGLSQSAASRHLTQLSASGYLVERRKENAKCYSLNAERLDDTLEAVRRFLLRSG